MNDFDITRYLRGAFLSVGTVYPIRLVTGFAASTLLYLVVASLNLTYPEVPIFEIITDNQKTFILSLGTIISFGKSLFRPLSTSDNVALWIDSIEDIAKRAEMTKIQRNMLWQTVAKKIIDSMNLEKELNKDTLQRIGSEAAREQPDSGSNPPDIPA